MAKATGLSSQFRGKVGNVIGYLTKNRAGKYEQTVKAYQPVVANPQSYAQALARVPVGPVQRICSALLPIVQRGFEGVAYGDPSKSEFLSYNLKNFRGPFMTKGTVMVPPGPVMISNGSLQPVTARAWTSDRLIGLCQFSLACPSFPLEATKGEIATLLLGSNNYLSRGEQLTIVTCHLSGGQYTYRYESLILDPSDTSLFTGCGILLTSYRSYLAVNAEIAVDLGTLVAAAIVRSQSYGQTSFRRSTTYLSCNPAAELYNDQQAVSDAVASYRTGEDPEDWQDDPTPEYQQLAYLCMVTITTDMVTDGSSSIVDGTQCLGYVTKGGDMGIFYLYSRTYNANVLIDGNAQILVKTESGVFRPYYYNAAYAPARLYTASYGTMHN